MSSLRKRFIRSKAKIKYQRIFHHLTKDGKILDIGTGNGALCKILREKGYNVQPLDIKNHSYFKEVTPKIFDGIEIPYPNNTFEIALLITVLHHTKRPEHLIKEATRVADKIIIMEDIYTNKVQKHLTFLADSIVNQEFSGHPHTNKTDLEWKSIFKDQGLKLVSQSDHPAFLLLFRQITYVLEKV